MDLIIEILECQNAICDSEFDEDDKIRLKDLESRGLVQLVWVVTEKGKSRSKDLRLEDY